MNSLFLIVAPCIFRVVLSLPTEERAGKQKRGWFDWGGGGNYDNSNTNGNGNGFSGAGTANNGNSNSGWGGSGGNNQEVSFGGYNSNQGVGGKPAAKGVDPEVVKIMQPMFDIPSKFGSDSVEAGGEKRRRRFAY